jgi:hypothetical protein
VAEPYKHGSKGAKRPANRVMGAQISGQRRANAIDAVVERAERGNRDEVRESQIKRR